MHITEFDEMIEALFEEDNLVLDETKADPAAWATVIGGDADFEEEF